VSGRRLASALAYEIAQPQIDRLRNVQAQARAARDAAGSVWRGGQGLRAMGGRRAFSDRARAQVGGEFWHGASDRRAAVEQLALDFRVFQNDLTSGQLSPQDVAWMALVVTPTLTSWQEFATHELSSGLASAMTEWSVFESWWERLRRLRELARARGIVLESPEPVRLPRTVWERAAAGTGSEADVWISALKTGILGAMALVGAASLYTIVRDFRKAESK